MQKLANVSLMHLTLENVQHKTYFFRFLDIDFIPLDMLHIPKKESIKKARGEESKAKLLFKQDNGDLDFEFWRTADVTKLVVSVPTSNNRSLNEEVADESNQLFKHDLAVSSRHAFVRFSVFSVAPSSYSSAVTVTIAPLARLNVYVATTFTCLRADRSESVCGHRQKLYCEAISAFLSFAFAQFT